MVGFDDMKNLANEHSDTINEHVDSAQEQHGDKVNQGVDAAQEKFLTGDVQDQAENQTLGGHQA